MAQSTLISGQAWDKFRAICAAQGGLKLIESADFSHCVRATSSGVVAYINNRFIARLASLAGAPNAPTAGMDLHVRLGDDINQGDPLFTLYAEAPGELAYALDFLDGHTDVIRIEREMV